MRVCEHGGITNRCSCRSLSICCTLCLKVARGVRTVSWSAFCKVFQSNAAAKQKALHPKRVRALEMVRRMRSVDRKL